MESPIPSILFVVPKLKALHCFTTSSSGPSLEFKEIVDVLQPHVCCFWEEEIHCWDENDVEHSKDDVCLPANVVNRRRRKFHNGKVDDPETSRGHRSASGSELQCADLGGVKPGACQPALGEDGVEKEQHRGPDNSGSVTTIVNRDGQN